MKYLECKPCSYFAAKSNGKKKTVCNLAEPNEPPECPIKRIIWCKIFEQSEKRT